MNEFMQMLFGGMQGLPQAPSPLAPTTPAGDPWAMTAGPPLPPPRPKEQARMGLDQSGLAALSADASRYWPETAKEIGEAYGAPQGPLGQGFVTPDFIGPMPPTAMRTTPFRNEIPTRAMEGMMDMNSPIAEDEFQALVRRLFTPAQQGRPGSVWM